MEQLVIADLGVPWGHGKHLLKWRKAIGVGQVELASAAGVSHQLVSFIETETQTFTESAKSKLWSAILRLGFDRAKKENAISLADWQRVLAALSKIEEKKRAERTERWEKLQAEWMKSFLAGMNLFAPVGGQLFSSLNLPEIEAEQQRIIEEGQSSLELSILIDEQLGEFQKYFAEQVTKEEVLEQYCALWASTDKQNRELRDLEAKGYALFLKSDMEAKDKRITELVQELRALRAEGRR